MIVRNPHTQTVVAADTPVTPHAVEAGDVTLVCSLPRTDDTSQANVNSCARLFWRLASFCGHEFVTCTVPSPVKRTEALWCVCARAHVCVCMYVCVWRGGARASICVCVCVCSTRSVCVCVRSRAHTCLCSVVRSVHWCVCVCVHTREFERGADRYCLSATFALLITAGVSSSLL